MLRRTVEAELEEYEKSLLVHLKEDVHRLSVENVRTLYKKKDGM